MLPLSKRTEALGTENAFVVLAEVNRLLAEGKSIKSFCIGQPDFTPPDHARIAAIDSIVQGKTGYTPSAGIMPLREAVAAEFTKTRGVQVKADDVVIGCGAKPFIGNTIMSVCDYGEGHEVLYPNPGFPIYESMIKAAGAVPVPLELHEKNDFAFDLNDLERKITAKSRLLILCSPHNPTGGVLSKKMMAQIAKIVAKHDQLWVYSDEPYSKLVYDGPLATIEAEPGMLERTVIVDCCSKTYAMPGWRLGYAANRILAPHLTRWNTNIDSCPPAPSQYAALAALTASQQCVEEMRKSFHERRDIIVKLLNSIPGISCRTPGGAFYVWPNVTQACEMVGAKDSEELRRRLLHEAGVAVLADIHFGKRIEGEGQHLRFSYATGKADIIAGLERVADFIKKHAKSTPIRATKPAKPAKRNGKTTKEARAS
ncbi:MAG: pyridoxal phosphate-dependent aminotransferase [Planctomycetes bacterium]|nr:pyridoxal phosphate-dependent aminotransferase [Planctomycetota bacterium]MCC7170330.1 pyridoxal phosphate-dependent aminotransferase [Planctomycetota bacterium]